MILEEFKEACLENRSFGLDNITLENFLSLKLVHQVSLIENQFPSIFVNVFVRSVITSHSGLIHE